MARLSSEQRREFLSVGNPNLRSVLSMVSRLERTILIVKGLLINLEEDKDQLEKAIYKLLASETKKPEEGKVDESSKNVDQ